MNARVISLSPLSNFLWNDSMILRWKKILFLQLIFKRKPKLSVISSEIMTLSLFRKSWPVFQAEIIFRDDEEKYQGSFGLGVGILIPSTASPKYKPRLNQLTLIFFGIKQKPARLYIILPNIGVTAKVSLRIPAKEIILFYSWEVCFVDALYRINQLERLCTPKPVYGTY